MIVQPYLNFEGRCEEAIEFYQRTLGATVVMLMRNSDAPGGAEQGCPGAPPTKVLHAALQIGETVVMATDGANHGATKFDGFSLSLTVADDAEATRFFTALGSEGGTVIMPLEKTFFASLFGMVKDRFGITWMVLPKPPTA